MNSISAKTIEENSFILEEIVKKVIVFEDDSKEKDKYVDFLVSLVHYNLEPELYEEIKDLDILSKEEFDFLEIEFDDENLGNMVFSHSNSVKYSLLGMILIYSFYDLSEESVDLKLFLNENRDYIAFIVNDRGIFLSEVLIGVRDQKLHGFLVQKEIEVNQLIIYNFMVNIPNIKDSTDVLNTINDLNKEIVKEEVSFIDDEENGLIYQGNRRYSFINFENEPYILEEKTLQYNKKTEELE